MLVLLIAAQSVLGLLFRSAYRDSEWIRATWFGNDCVTLLVAVPLIWTAQRRARTGSARAVMLRTGATAYVLYNDAFYVFGAQLNVFFPLYIAIGLAAGVALGRTMWSIDAPAVAAAFARGASLRVAGAYLAFVGVALGTIWLWMWGAYALAGRPTPIEPEAFKVVAALDLLLLVPALAAGGALLVRKRPWGYVLATTAAVQGSLYLIVLTVNAAIAIRWHLVAAPGELPIWASLAILTSCAALVLLRAAGGHATA